MSTRRADITATHSKRLQLTATARSPSGCLRKGHINLDTQELSVSHLINYAAEEKPQMVIVQRVHAPFHHVTFKKKKREKGGVLETDIFMLCP
jgi:hypothetical protein